MRTTVNLDKNLYENAAKAAGVSEKTRLIHMGFEALIRKTASERLARVFGSYKRANAPRRRRPS
ncbi:MAG: type II toxin-antitoxin system VapB family antitoxin [Deltaproteobacteria bacterium]|nr:type II toxin-antitoxin system VapB family antitoxin [Deltaproteobacteria bacterium]